MITTVNIQHLESLNDEVERITGVKQRETVPDEVVRAADQIQLVDMSPQALRRRMAHGNIYRAEQVDASLSSYFRVGNLTALRELALLWLADRVDDALDDVPARRTGSSTRGRPRSGSWSRSPAAPRARPCCAAGRGSPSARPARSCWRVHVVATDGLPHAADTRGSPSVQQLVESLGGTFHTVVGEDVSARGRRLRDAAPTPR